eukprot:CAMPEP_0169080956 /NCGR_PEP_ID=MMETSP1015-20121227/10755_1 /TAXON_ID=342587 /ORGANISM="Karlodinium micrum, Strain CCMP2283" /LENGTH=177 /DNA_ID=CAMNT_0009140715 /DNA_START=246 /DNA_END=779 /DNA_ORIENTATION=+
MRHQLKELNSTVQQWLSYNVAVNANVSARGERTIANNSQEINISRNATVLDEVKEKLHAYTEKMDEEQAKANSFSKSLGLGDLNATGKDNAGGIFDRLDKAKQSYLLNGTKIIRGLKVLSGMEDKLVNFTDITERIVERQTADNMAEIPKEMQRQLDTALQRLRTSSNLASNTSSAL